MRAVRGKHTLPELTARRAAHRLGLRFRLFSKDLPGKPDLTFPRFRTVLFVNGCFWHQHSGCPRSKLPKSNVAYWREKLGRNVVRDDINYEKLKKAGWRVLLVWECEIPDMDAAKDRLRNWFPPYSREQPKSR